MEMISFVIPCYRSALTIKRVVDEIFEAMNDFSDRYQFEVILVNDCSPDNTYEIIKELAEEHKNIKGFSLSTNFGQQSALMAGFHNVSGDIVICLDDDGQTPPKEVGKLIGKFEEGYDVVYASYRDKKHSWFRNIGSKANDIMADICIGKPRDLFISSYFILSRFVIDEIIKYENPYPYTLGLILRTTKNIANVDVDHKAREQGKSGYTLSKLIGLWLNGFTAFSIKPLRVATSIGVVISLMALVYIFSIVIRKIILPDVSVGWSSLMSVLLFIGGAQMCMMGMLGEYIGRIYISLNNSPQYIIRECTPSCSIMIENENS